MSPFIRFSVATVFSLIALAVSGPVALSQASAAAAARATAACGPALAGSARCHARIKPLATATYQSGYAPADLQSAYSLPSSTNGSGQTVAIVDAYNDPNAESDLNTYGQQFYGPGFACTTANGCFKKVAQDGSANYPRPDQGWVVEISLDIEMVVAVCPHCKIVLVEASSNSLGNLLAAEDQAALQGSTEISNSWGTSTEFSLETSYDGHFNKPGIAITASSGDNGYGVIWPAASPWVTAAGGTSLVKSCSGGTCTYSETAWSGAGSGCSAYEPQQSWQSGNNIIPTVCKMRAVADVSAVADPNTGVAVYDSYGYHGQKGWFVVGGTSVASPIIASVFALASNTGSATHPNSYPYTFGTPTNLNDITTGSNGSCGGSALCTAGIGWDGPTGLGTPNGTSAF